MLPLFDLSGKTAIVTGAVSGIGFAIAMRLSAAGAEVHVLDINQSTVDDAVAKLNRGRQLKHKCVGHACNVASESAVKAAFSAVCSAGRRIDILICNAGISSVGTVLQTSEAEMERVYKVNVLGVFLCLKYGVERMLADGKGGAIVNLASIASLVGLADRFAYSMTKGAVLTMTRSVAVDYVKKNIRCNCVCPGRIHTPFVDGFLKKNYPGREAEMFAKLAAYQPVGRMGKPEEVAALIHYLVSDESSFVTGAAYPIDGGKSAL